MVNAFLLHILTASTTFQLIIERGKNGVVEIRVALGSALKNLEVMGSNL